MRFRAVLSDPGALHQERPSQTFSDNRQIIDEWAATVLRSAVADDAAVKIFAIVEQEVAVVRKDALLGKTLEQGS